MAPSYGGGALAGTLERGDELLLIHPVDGEPDQSPPVIRERPHNLRLAEHGTHVATPAATRSGQRSELFPHSEHSTRHDGLRAASRPGAAVTGDAARGAVLAAS